MALATPQVAQAVGETKNPQLAVPLLMDAMFPDWFAGVAFAAIGVGALVPAAIMSIAAANLFTRNIYKAYLKPDATPAHETKISQLASLIVKAGALGFVLVFSKTLAINLQLLGGIWITQTFPAVALGVFTRWFHRWALLVGWACGMVYGTWTMYLQPNPSTGAKHFGASTAEIPLLGEVGYIALTAFALNLLVSVVLTVIFRAIKLPDGRDETATADYSADADDDSDDAGEPRAKQVPEPVS
jgi:solute:Na+ symporter, SSS family